MSTQIALQIAPLSVIQFFAVRHSGLGTRLNPKLRLMHTYEIRPRKDNRGFHYAQNHSCSDDAVTRVYDETGNIVELHEQPGGFKDP